MNKNKFSFIYSLLTFQSGPLFNANEPANRLDATDAHYVEIIHTDNDSFGIGYPLGDADFYPNGGTGMPGCLSKLKYTE